MSFEEWWASSYGEDDVEEVCTYERYAYGGGYEDAVSWDTVESLVREAFEAGAQSRDG